MPGDYNTLKALHVTFVFLSLGGFVFRGILRFRVAALPRHPLLRRLPHVNDTLLLVFGVWLLIAGPWSLGTAHWLQLKLLLLLVYIGLGFVALHRGRFSSDQQRIAWLAAVTVFACMLWLAHFKPI